jgi:uncharacterized phage-associated protein
MSPEIANEFIALGLPEGKAFSQTHLQNLVYIAHGWRLALMGQPLTCDRPEMLEYGPEYRRLADALRASGAEPVDRLIAIASRPGVGGECELSPDERAIIARVYSKFGGVDEGELATLNRARGTVWEHVFIWFGEGPELSSPADQKSV